MKHLSKTLLRTVAVSAFAVSTTAASAVDALPPRATGLLRGATSSSSSAAAVEEGIVPHLLGNEEATTASVRVLQSSDPACYQKEYYTVGDDSELHVKADGVGCDTFATCDNVPACALTQQDAIGAGLAFCSAFKVTSVGQLACEYQYECCT